MRLGKNNTHSGQNCHLSPLTRPGDGITSRSPRRTATRRTSREPLSRLACGDSRPRQSDAIRLAEARFFASASVDVRDFVRLEQCGLSVQSRVGSHPFS